MTRLSLYSGTRLIVKHQRGHAIVSVLSGCPCWLKLVQQKAENFIKRPQYKGQTSEDRRNDQNQACQAILLLLLRDKVVLIHRTLLLLCP